MSVFVVLVAVSAVGLNAYMLWDSWDSINWLEKTVLLLMFASVLAAIAAAFLGALWA